MNGPIRVGSVPDLISTVPFTLGFTPRESIVVAALSARGRLLVTMRAGIDDLTSRMGGPIAAQIAAALDACRQAVRLRPNNEEAKRLILQLALSGRREPAVAFKGADSPAPTWVPPGPYPRAARWTVTFRWVTAPHSMPQPLNTQWATLPRPLTATAQ